MRRIFLGVAAVLLFAALSCAEEAPSSGPLDARIRYVNYKADEVVRIDAS